MARKTPEQYRKAELAKIHIAKKALALDDDTYRDILQNVCKATSSKDLDSQARFKLLKHFESLGWASTSSAAKKYGRKPRVNGDKTALMGKLEALLADSRLPWSYANSMAKRMFKVDQVAWLDAVKLHKLVAALQINANRQKGGES